MSQIHPLARITPRTRAEIEASKASAGVPACASAFIAFALLALPGCGDSGAQPAAPPLSSAVTDELTPVVAVAHTSEATPVLGSDGKHHLIYELRLMNARAVQATVLEVQAVDAANPERVLGKFEGASLLASLRTLNNKFAEDARLDVNSARLLLMHLVFDSRAAIPVKVVHRLRVLGGSIDSTDPLPVEQSYRAGPITVSARTLPVLGPPLRGTHWVAINGCCGPDGVHRNTGLPVNGDIRFAQRFAIDWMRLNPQGFLLSGSERQVRNYTAYGADVLAVADGTVISTLDTLDDQTPPSLPAPASITLATADGNHIVLDVGGGFHAFYAHLQKGTGGVKVKVGDRVTRGQSIGTLGNSGNTSAPHLHFHLMDGPSVLGSNGVPYLIDSYAYSGQITDAIANVAGLSSNFNAALFQQVQPRAQSLPLDFAVVDFP